MKCTNTRALTFVVGENSFGMIFKADFELNKNELLLKAGL